MGQPVEVKLVDGVKYTGRLNNIDGLMNITLEGVTEMTRGVETDQFEECFVRGNNGKPV